MAPVFQRIHHRDPKRPEQRSYLSRHGAAHGRCVHLPADRLRPGFIRGIQQVVLHVMNFNKKELTTLEQAMADAAEEAAAAKGDLEGGAN